MRRRSHTPKRNAIDGPLGRASADIAGQIQTILREAGVPAGERESTYRVTEKVLARLLYELKHPGEMPTAVEERNALEILVKRMHQLEQAWADLPRSTKLQLGSARGDSFVEFEDKLECVMERANQLLDQHMLVEEFDEKNQQIVRRLRTAKDNRSRPFDKSRREALRSLCDIWLRNTLAGRECLSQGRWLRGSKSEAASFANDLLETVSGGGAEHSNERMLRAFYDAVLAEAMSVE